MYKSLLLSVLVVSVNRKELIKLYMCLSGLCSGLLRALYSPVSFHRLIYFDDGLILPSHLFWQVALTVHGDPAPLGPFRIAFAVTFYLFVRVRTF